MSLKSCAFGLAFLTLAALLCCLSACEGESAREEGAVPVAVRPEPRGGDYRAPLLNEPQTLDPVAITDDYGAAVAQQVFEGLVGFSADLLIVPSLAASWEVEDEGTLYRFHLRPDARFHNGREVTAEDVAFSIRRLIRSEPPSFVLPHLLRILGAEAYRAGRAEALQGLEVVDAETVVIRLSEPYAPLLAALGMYQTKIVPAEAVMSEDRDFGRLPVGSGPFRFVSWQPGGSIVLERFPDYHGGPARLDRVIFRIYPGGDIERVLEDFLSGRLEDMPVFGAVRRELEAVAGLQWVRRPSLSLLFYGLNCEHPLLADTAVRKLLSWAVDREALVSRVYGGQFVPTRRILPPGLPGYRPEDGEGARVEDLKAGGAFQRAMERLRAEKPVIEVLSGSQSPQARAELDFVGKAWAGLSVTLVPRFVDDWALFESKIASHEMTAYRYVWFADFPHPDNFLQPLFESGSQANFMRFRSEAVDRLLRDARGISDPVRQAESYRRIEDAVVEAMPLIPLFYLTNDRVLQPYVRDLHLNALGSAYTSLHRVSLGPH